MGEGDTVWPQVLADFRQNKLQPVYKAQEYFAMSKMAVPRFDLLRQDAYMQATRAASRHGVLRIPIETSRGCPHKCAFCYVSRYFGPTSRFRPIEDVVEEVAQFPGAYVFFVDDNIAANPPRAKALFKALTPLGIRWVGQFTVLAAKDKELLELAAQSGCINAFIGLESVFMESLSSVHKAFSLSQSVPETLTAFRDAGIDPQVSLIFGFDGDTLETLDQTIDVMIAQKVHLLYAFILTPFPGTELHEQMEREGRILHRDYSCYDGRHVVFRPRQMSPDELEKKFWEAYRRFYSASSITRRFSDWGRWAARNRFRPYLHNLAGNLFFRRMINRRIHPLAGGIPEDA